MVGVACKTERCRKEDVIAAVTYRYLCLYSLWKLYGFCRELMGISTLVF